jgi:hypothetical protein
MCLRSCRSGRPLAAFALLLLASRGFAAEKAATVYAPNDGPRVIVRDAGAKAFRPTKDGEALPAGAQVIGGLSTALRSPNGAVTARLVADFGGHSPFPILETSVLLNDPKGADLAIQMDRGRLDLENSKKEGAATIALTIRGKNGTITLPKPGDRAVIEMYSRWPRGTRFTKTPKETDVPALAVVMIAAKGDIDLKTDEGTLNLKAPPGPAMVLLDSLTDAKPHVEFLEKTPAWVDEKDTEVLLKIADALAKFRADVEKKSLSEALVHMVKSDNETARATALILLGATDDLEHLAIAVATAKHQDVIDEAIIVLRHWIGREPGQDLKLYNLLLNKGMYAPAEAEMALQLLHSFSRDDLRQAETYQALIHFLDSDRPLIRALAHWHLIRLAPEGKSIGFKAIMAKDERAKTIKAWEQLIPPGTIPGSKK